ncbi:unnamed protein product [Paramecium pentaurelia]|uniref:RING-type domain-containing protein n=1 Tax=Paramecium pentaurelia TaxID=43138 RepID=A0A8S1SNE4_9CILI|nr:unnamed protein product [Paramecium pentaurelia]
MLILLIISTLIPLYKCESILFNNSYLTEINNMNFTLKQENFYLIQLQILEFPKDQRFSLQLIVTSKKNDINLTFVDADAFHEKVEFQNIYVNKTDEIAINVLYKKICNYQAEDIQQFNYSIFLIESPQEQVQCKFPYYLINCTQQLRSEEIPNTQITIAKNKWIYFYYRIEQNEYQLLIENGKSDIGVSLVPFNISRITKLPSFNSYFSLIPQEYIYQVKLKRQGNQLDSVVIVGLYNFNQTSEAEINLSLDSIIASDDTFPIWGILVIIGVIVLAILIIIYLAIQFRRQLKVLSLETPEIGLEMLDKYMPSKTVQSSMLNDFCCICLVNYEENDIIRETPCGHTFHDKCIIEWFKKNKSCPYCRLEFTEEEFQRLMLQKQTDTSPENKKNQNSNFIQRVTSLKLIQNTNQQQRRNLEDSTSQLNQVEEIPQQNYVQPFNIFDQADQN